MPAGMIYAQAWIIQKRAYVLSGKLFYASTIPVGGFCCRSKRLGRLERAHPAVLLKFSFVLFHPLIVPSKQKALNDAKKTAASSFLSTGHLVISTSTGISHHTSFFNRPPNRNILNVVLYPLAIPSSWNLTNVIHHVFT
jgi:hypothetical protein